MPTSEVEVIWPDLLKKSRGEIAKKDRQIQFDSIQISRHESGNLLCEINNNNKLVCSFISPMPMFDLGDTIEFKVLDSLKLEFSWEAP